jgi:hypothetical protein
MSSASVATVKQLVKEISTLSTSLLDSDHSVPKGTKDDKIWSVMNTDERDTPHETFNQRFDAMFAEDCRNSVGRVVCNPVVGRKYLGFNLNILKDNSY